MGFELYVGNYPSTLTSDELLTLFQDFEGIELLRFLKKVNKCYSFLRCVNRDQMIEVVMTMNDMDVYGRNLIVRATDDSEQAAIEQLMKQHGRTEKYVENVRFGRASKSFSPGSMPGNYENLKTRRNVLYDTSVSPTYNCTSSLNTQYKAERNSFNTMNVNLFNCPQANHQDYQQQRAVYDYQKNSGDKIMGHNSEVEYSFHHNRNRFSFPHDDPSQYNYCGGDKKIGYYHVDGIDHNISNRDSYASNVSANKHYNSEALTSERCQDKLFFVSVVNFPLGTPIKDLYALFSDYNPCDIKEICNVPRADKTPTEAIISFKSRKDATDAIINLDNTVYRRRVLLVTDTTDLSLVPELLIVGGKDIGSKEKARKESYNRPQNKSNYYKNTQNF